MTCRKLLGVSYLPNGDASSTGKKGVAKASLKINTIHIPEKMGPRATTIMANIYIVNEIWGLVVAKPELKDLMKLDKQLTRKLRKHYGKTRNDCAIDILLPFDQFGGGIVGFVDTNIKAIAREMEEVLSNPYSQGTAARSSLKLSESLTNTQNKEIGYTRAMDHNIKVLAGYGLFVRDMNNLDESIFLELLRKRIHEKSINGVDPEGTLDRIGKGGFTGAGRFKEAYVGGSNKKLTNYMINGRYSMMFVKRNKKVKSRKRLVEDENSWTADAPTNKKEMSEIYGEALSTIEEVLNASHTYEEWRISEGDEDPLAENAKWVIKSSNWKVDQTKDKSVREQVERQIIKHGQMSRIKHTDDEHEDIIDTIIKNPLPPAVATDGSHVERVNGSNRNTASATILVCEDYDEDETGKEVKWKPIMSRRVYLPDKIGADKVDNGHCEAMAVCLAEEMLPTALPAVYISDSLSVIGGFRLLRDGNIPNNRIFIRRILSGLGKCFMVRLLRNVALWSKPTMNYLKNSACILNSHGVSEEPFMYTEGNSNLSYKQLVDDDDDEYEDDTNKEEKEIKHALELLEFLYNNRNTKSADEVVNYVGTTAAFSDESFDIKKQIIKLQNFRDRFKDSISNEASKLYPSKYVDLHPHRCIMMVNSHQYKKEDDKPTGRLEKITPFKSAAMMNHLADKICDTMFINETIVDRMFDIYGIRFRIFGGGEEFIKSVTRTIQKYLNQERRIILGVRPAQGLMARMQGKIDISAIESGQKGNIARHMRAQGANIVRAIRLDSYLKLLHVIQIEGKLSNNNIDINNIEERDINKYIKDPIRSSGVYEFCKVCGKDEIEEHRRNIDSFFEYLNMSKEERKAAREDINNGEVWQEPNTEMDDWRRHSVLHSCICECDEMIAARNIGRNLIERNLTKLFEYADELVAVDSLYNYLLEGLREHEKEKYVGCMTRNTKNKYDRIIYERQYNSTILDKDDWEYQINEKTSLNNKTFNKEMAMQSLRNFRYGITLGIFKPETVNVKSIHEQCVLDTCWAGWTPRIYQELIGKWLNERSREGCFDGQSIGNIKGKLIRLYRQVKTAIYINAEFLSKVSRNKVHKHKKELIQQASSEASVNVERFRKDEIEIEEGYIIGDEGSEEDGNSVENESRLSDISISDIEDTQEDSEDDEGNDEEEEEEEEEEEKPPKANTSKKTYIQCTKTRCRIARDIGTDIGKVTDESKTCGKCNNFNKDLASFVKWEDILIQQHMNTLIKCLDNPNNKNNNKIIEELIKKAISTVEEEQEETDGSEVGLKYSKRHNSMLANTLTITSVKSLPDNIDKKPLNSTNRSIRDEAGRLCKCEGDEVVRFGNQDVNELPQICGRCERVIAISTADNQDESKCNACGGETSKEVKRNAQGICNRCRVMCLIRTNNLQSRYNKKIEELNDEQEGGSPTKKHARNLVKEGDTDPTLVSKEGNNNKDQIEERLNRRVSKESNERVNGMLMEEKYRILWKSQYDKREKASFIPMHVLNTEKGLNNCLLAALLANLNETYEGCKGTFGVVSMSFYHQLQNSNKSWSEMRNNFFQCEDYDWENLTESAPLINSDVLWIPICTDFGDTYSKWALVVRFVKDRDEEAEEPYIFVMVDPRDNSIRNTTAKEMKKLIRRKTNLQDNYKNIHNDEVNDEDVGNSTKWYQCTKGPLIENCEDGYRLLLNMVVCFTASGTNDLDRRMRSLNEIEDLDIKTRQWILSILEKRRTFKWDDTPPWLSEITKMENKQTTQQTSEEEGEEEDDESEDDEESEDGVVTANNNKNSRDKIERELKNRRKRITEVRKEVEDDSEDGNNSEQQQKKVRFSIKEVEEEEEEKEEEVQQPNKRKKTIRRADETTNADQVPNINELLEERSFECDHMRTIIPNMASYTKNTKSNIVDIDFYHRITCVGRELESTWEEIRGYLNPGNAGAFKPNTNSTNSTACIDAEKLIIPIQTVNPEHFTCVIRFPATQNNVTWDFAFIDSMNKDELSMKVRDTIQKETTLANDYPNLKNVKPNVENASATWRRIECKKQVEVECGARMLLHIYIATQSTNITELEMKIQRLNQVNELQAKTRQWAVEWLEHEVAATPAWLEEVLR